MKLMMKCEEISKLSEVVEEKNKKTQINTIINNSKFTTSQCDILHKFYQSFNASDLGKMKSYSTLIICFNVLKNHTFWINNCCDNKSYTDITQQEIKEYIASLKERGLKNSSIITYKAFIKKFYEWLGKESIVSWITYSPIKKYLEESSLLDEEEVQELINATPSIKKKAIISLLDESAFRVGELTDIKIKNIVFDTDTPTAKITVNGKTGKRTVTVIKCIPYIKNLINIHPFGNNPEGYLFFSEKHGHYGEKIRGNSLGPMIKKMVKHTNIRKNVYPHVFRHSKLNRLAKEGFNERDLRIFAGWSSTSTMPDVYLHYGENVVNDKILKMNGIIKEEKTKKSIKVKFIKCVRCNNENPPDSIYCNCGMVLNSNKVIKEVLKKQTAETELDKMFEDGEFRTMFKEYLKKKQK